MDRLTSHCTDDLMMTKYFNLKTSCEVCKNNLILMRSPAIIRCRHYVFILSMHPPVPDYILELSECDILQTAFRNFTKFTTEVQVGTKMNELNLFISRSEGDELLSDKHFRRYSLQTACENSIKFTT